MDKDNVISFENRELFEDPLTHFDYISEELSAVYISIQTRDASLRDG